MVMVLALGDVKPDQVRNRKPKGDGSDHGGTHTNFFKPTTDKPDNPDAFLVQYTPGGTSNAHFHSVDEFQVLVNGEGNFGRRHVVPYTVHYARAYTPYGPLSSKGGWGFLTLRIDKDKGTVRDFQKLKEIPGRKPWQVSCKAEFPVRGDGPSVAPIAEITDALGLFAQTLTIPPHGRFMAPDPSSGRGQYIVLTRGSLLHEGKEHESLAVVFVKPNEPAYRLQAGEQGLEAIVMNFPRKEADGAQSQAEGGFKKWQCILCAFAYDEALGLPEEGIPPGTRWADVPDTWTCPDCSAIKSDFEMIEID